MPLKTTAVLLFIRSPFEEARIKPILGLSKQQNIQLFEKLNKKAKQTAAKTGFPLFVCSSKNQKGHSFAQRYNNAIREVFNKGFKNVIVLGNDSPKVSVETITKIASALNHHDVVYGATNHGGIFSLALTQKGFNTLNFKLLPWQTPQLAEAFMHLKKSGKSIYKIDEQLEELNAYKDIVTFKKALLKSVKQRFIYGGLVGLNIHFQLTDHFPFSTINRDFFSKNLLRGPPPTLFNK